MKGGDSNRPQKYLISFKNLKSVHISLRCVQIAGIWCMHTYINNALIRCNPVLCKTIKCNYDIYYFKHILSVNVHIKTSIPRTNAYSSPLFSAGDFDPQSRSH